MKDMRKWEDMPTEFLINIFGRVPLESRLLDIPLVCKPWLQALRNPLCWQKLDFPASVPFFSKLRSSYEYSRNPLGIKLIPLIFNLSQRCATSLWLPEYCSRNELLHVPEECPGLKKLVLPAYLCRVHPDIISSLVVKLKNLEFLGIGSTRSDWIVEIFKLIGVHLPNLSSLWVTSRNIDDDVALAIVALPKLKHLYMNEAELSKENLLLIMRSCKELVSLYVLDCTGFDEEILKLSSSIQNFCCDGSTSYDESNCYMDIYDGDDSDYDEDESDDDGYDSDD